MRVIQTLNVGETCVQQIVLVGNITCVIQTVRYGKNIPVRKINCGDVSNIRVTYNTILLVCTRRIYNVHEDVTNTNTRVA